MEAPRSASSRLSGAPGWTGVTGGIGIPLLSKEVACWIPEPHRSPDTSPAEGRTEYGPPHQSSWGLTPPGVWRWGFRLLAPPERLPGLERSFGTAPPRRPWPWGSERLAVTRWPSPWNPANLLMRITGSYCGPDCNIITHHINTMRRRNFMGGCKS